MPFIKGTIRGTMPNVRVNLILKHFYFTIALLQILVVMNLDMLRERKAGEKVNMAVGLRQSIRLVNSRELDTER